MNNATGDSSQKEHQVLDSPTSRQELIEAGQAGVRKHLEILQDTHRALSDATRMFREQLSITYRECGGVVGTLQALRKQTEACLEFLQHGGYLFPALQPYFQTINSLSLLDGEKTARLVLEMDLFRSMVSRAFNETLPHAKERINLHVALQGHLLDEVKCLRELLSQMEQLMSEEPPLSPCQNAENVVSA